jgi:FAD/FMN-containing dehydrogenase
MLSFPMEGYTLALDFPANPHTLGLLSRLDAIVAAHGGRVYLAKDARMKPEMMHGYPELAAFRKLRRAADPSAKFSSLQSERLQL